MSVFLKSFFVVLAVLFISASAIAAPPQMNIPNKTIDSDNIFYDALIDLWDIATDETPDSQLVFKILSESNLNDLDCFIDNGRNIACVVLNQGVNGAHSIIKVEVTDTNSEKTIDTFVVFLKNNGGSFSSICNDIEIFGGTIRINENSEETVSLLINNLADEGFGIDRIRVNENSSKIRADNETWLDGWLDLDGSTDLEFNLESFNVSRNTNATITAQIKGEFDNGVKCGFNDIEKDFRVFIEEERDFSSAVCRDIKIDDSRIILSEDDAETVEVVVKNESNRSFDVTSVGLNKKNFSDFKVGVSKYPSEIGSGDEEVIKLMFETDKVSRDETGKITLRMSGRFSSGKGCSSSTISEQIDVTVENGRSFSGDSDDIGIRFNPSSIELNPEETKFVTATIENNKRSRKCVDLEFLLSNSNFISGINRESVCIDGRDDKTVDIDIRAKSTASIGNYSGKLEAKFGSKKSGKNINIKVLGSAKQVVEGDLEIISYPQNISLVPNGIERFNVTISNSTNSPLTNLALTMDNLPDGVFFQPFFKQKLEKGEIATIIPIIETGDVKSGQFDAVLVVSSDGRTISRTVKINIAGETMPEQPPNMQSPLSGFAPLARTAGIGIVLLAVLVIVVIIIVLIVKR